MIGRRNHIVIGRIWIETCEQDALIDAEVAVGHSALPADAHRMRIFSRLKRGAAVIDHAARGFIGVPVYGCITPVRVGAHRADGWSAVTCGDTHATIHLGIDDREGDWTDTADSWYVIAALEPDDSCLCEDAEVSRGKARRVHRAVLRQKNLERGDLWSGHAELELAGEHGCVGEGRGAEDDDGRRYETRFDRGCVKSHTISLLMC